MNIYHFEILHRNIKLNEIKFSMCTLGDYEAEREETRASEGNSAWLIIFLKQHNICNCILYYISLSYVTLERSTQRTRMCLLKSAALYPASL